MEKIICACGHENPFGTKLCEKCGRPLTEEVKNQKVLDMRYDGIAIRSKTRNKSIVDKIWNFFSSVKVGVSLIFINLVAASIGTIFPQEFYVNVATEAEREIYYEETYGSLGKLYYTLGLSDVYSSWWFQILVGLLGISIIIASLDRGIPLHRSLKNQRVKRHESFMKRQRVVAEGPVTAGDSAKTLDLVEEQMKKLKYNVRREGNAILAERGRFARYGPYINHVGLIVFLLGVMLRLLPGFYVDESMWVREGDIRTIPGMDGYFIENEKFILELHDNEKTEAQIQQGVNAVAKNYQTNVKLYKQPDDALPGQTDNLELVKEYSIRVNHPLKHEGYSLYQMDFRLNELKGMNFALTKKETGEELGDVSIDLTNPQKEYVIDDQTKVELLGYYPDFSGFKNGEPQTATSNPNNPAFIFKMTTPEKPDGEVSFVAIKETVEPNGDNVYKMSFKGIETRNMSGLTVHKDRTIPILIVGGIIFMLGVAIGSYWNHRRIWVEQLQDGTIRLAAHTNKNWFSIKKDLTAITEVAHLPQFIDQVEKENNEDGQKEKEGDSTL
ncbi:cytochrome c biogenesis protein ResB [Lysinibacillus endophyticus]|uniref:Cytochrome c biogenesis protein ResB n=1 Tax=Ureibacillus endophyticus TaxID=1978490 RepID=A0A494YVB7_9BACL|nr:cytochrome c biogenesis protein ResB [Lysinibacillus endophyticus]MCP1144238.1 cytochrome c biogenesis protein ResB [Lysinibacillus endophyticus]RKQ14075.1 cytochrome c biogenesis protein ResB [Lysinibacillus endophyticus]